MMEATTQPDAQLAARCVEQVRRCILSALEGQEATVVLFGSRATGHEHRWSDIDVGVVPGPDFDRRLLGTLREALEELAVPYDVELVDLTETAPAFRDKVLSEGEIWKS